MAKRLQQPLAIGMVDASQQGAITMLEIAYWLYLANMTLLVVHEMDSAYWREWDLFHLKGGAGAFLLVHIPLVLVLLWGAGEMRDCSTAGLALSMALAVAGVFAFLIHLYFIRRGHPEFKTPVSAFILGSTFLVSLVQLPLAVFLLRERLA